MSRRRCIFSIWRSANPGYCRFRLFDSIGLYRKCTQQQQEVALDWMRVFGIEELKDRSFLTLSSGEQRLALLARAFVKDPDLIILDEPLHGLDVSNKKKAAAIIEQFCARPGKTLIYVTHYPHELPASVVNIFDWLNTLKVLSDEI